MVNNLDLGLPALAVGTHERGSGKACVMNYVSYSPEAHAAAVREIQGASC